MLTPIFKPRYRLLARDCIILLRSQVIIPPPRYLLTRYSLRCLNMEQLSEGLPASLGHHIELPSPNQQLFGIGTIRRSNTQRDRTPYGRHYIVHSISPRCKSSVLHSEHHRRITHPGSGTTSRGSAVNASILYFINAPDR